MISNITDKIIPSIKKWQCRPLESIYPIVFMDAIHFKVKKDNSIVNKAAYAAIGVNIEGKKDVLGIWIGASESSKYWLLVLNELKNRRVKDIPIWVAPTFPTKPTLRKFIDKLYISIGGSVHVRQPKKPYFL